MRTAYIRPILLFDTRPQVERAHSTFRWLVKCGATVNRWRALIILSKTPKVIFSVIHYLGIMSTPLLEFLSLSCDGHPDVADMQEDDAMKLVTKPGVSADTYSLAHGPRRPQLRQVQLRGLLACFVFHQRSPVVSSLTKLSLIATNVLPPLSGFSAMLAASPQLESLSIDMSTIYWDRDCQDPGPLAPYKVCLFSLSSFSLNIRTVPKWGRQLLQILDSPGVHYFELSDNAPYDGVNSGPHKVYQYLGHGRVNGKLQVDSSLDADPHGGPIFPVLKRLNVVGVGAHCSTLLLEAFPLVAQVTLNLKWLEMLAGHPELLPRVSHLTFCAAPSIDVTQARIAVASVQARGRKLDVVFEVLEQEQEDWVSDCDDLISSTGEDSEEEESE